MFEIAIMKRKMCFREAAEMYSSYRSNNKRFQMLYGEWIATKFFIMV